MEHAIKNIRRELEHNRISFEYAKYRDDTKGMRFILGYGAGLERALAILNGDEAFVDDEVETWWDEREAGIRAGTIQVLPWAIVVSLGVRKYGFPVFRFSLRPRAASYVNRLTTVVAFLARHGIDIRLTEWRD